MLIINVETIRATREQLKNASTRQQAIDDIKKMIEIKQSLRSRAEWGSCCGNLGNIAAYLDRETATLESVLQAVEAKKFEAADSMLQEYERMIEVNNEAAGSCNC
jgi:hypothetical protein